jgi:hypothetical protein
MERVKERNGNKYQNTTPFMIGGDLPGLGAALDIDIQIALLDSLNLLNRICK